MIEIYKVIYWTESREDASEIGQLNYYSKDCNKIVSSLVELRVFKEKLKAITKIDAIDFYYKTK